MGKLHYPWWGYIKAIVRAYPGRMGADLSGVAKREFEAVQAAAEAAERMEDGQNRLKVIRLVHWDRTHQLPGAALMIPCSERTANRWQRSFFEEVAKNRDYIVLFAGNTVVGRFVVACVALSPTGRGAWNLWMGTVQKVDDTTNYQTKKEVEDTCRAMISSYEADRLTYQQYKGSDNSEKQSWAEQAKMRANKTAATYNNYILENSFVWAGNVPTDIKSELPYLE